jgi:transposase
MPTFSIDRPSACDDIAILYVALELSKSSWLVALNAPGSSKVSRHPVTGGDLAGLLALIERARTAAEARLGRPVRVVSCYEAGYDGFWPHRALTGRGSRTGCWTRRASRWTAGGGAPRRTISMSSG